MANKTNCTKNGIPYYRISRTVGKRLNKKGLWVDKRKEFYGVNKKDAEKQYEEYTAKQRENTITPDKCFGEIADYFVYKVFLKGKSAEATKEKYIRLYEQIIRTSDVAGKKISEITSRDFQEIYNASGRAPSTIRSLNNILRKIYKYIDQEGYGKDVTLNLIIPASKRIDKQTGKKILVWKEKELSAIAAGLENYRYRLFILLAIHTGCRLGELLAITYADISYTKQKLSITKQVILEAERKDDKKLGMKLSVSPILKSESSYRVLPLTDEMIFEIKQHKAWQEKEMQKNGYRTEMLFTTNTGGLIDRPNLNRALKRYYMQQGVPNHNVHTYRRTFATMLAQAGVPIQVLSALLGHESIEVTAKYYVDISDDEKLNAVEKIQIKTPLLAIS
jgi:integrase